MTKYLPLIQGINSYLAEFNSCLKPEFALEPLDVTKIENENYFLNIVDKEWDDIEFPRNRDAAGVYFYFAESQNNPLDIALYIGKASWSSNIGLRLWNHFNGRFKNGNMIEYYKEEPYKIELITSIPIEQYDRSFLAPALEEFLISKMQMDQYKLFNKTGNYQ